MVVAVRSPMEMAPKRHNVYEVPPPPDGTIGQLLHACRKARGWTQDDVMMRTTLSQGQVSAYEADKVKSPDPDRLLELDNLFGLEPGTFESRTGKRGAALRSTRAAPPPGSIVVMPDEQSPLYRITRVLKEKEDAELEALISVLRSGPHISEETIRETIDAYLALQKEMESPD